MSEYYIALSKCLEASVSQVKTPKILFDYFWMARKKKREM